MIEEKYRCCNCGLFFRAEGTVPECPQCHYKRLVIEHTKLSMEPLSQKSKNLLSLMKSTTMWVVITILLFTDICINKNPAGKHHFVLFALGYLMVLLTMWSFDEGEEYHCCG